MKPRPAAWLAFYGSVLLSALASSAVLTLLAATGTAWAGTDPPAPVPQEVCSGAG